MKVKRRKVGTLADLVCGNLGVDSPGPGEEPPHFIYCLSMCRTEFFADLDTDYMHDGSTRKHWVDDRIEEILAEPHDGLAHPPGRFCRLIDQLIAWADAINEALGFATTPRHE